MKPRRQAGRFLALATIGLLALPLLSGGTVLAQSDVDYDTDDDGLIEISNLAQLDAIRWDLDGNGAPETHTWRFRVIGTAAYAAAFPDAAGDMGCAGSCRGYELTTDLDFDTNGNGRVDAGDAYWHAGAGWEPLGGTGGYAGYSGELHGNGHSISNLYIDRCQENMGLFARLSGRGFVHHLGLINVDITNTGCPHDEQVEDTGAVAGEIMSSDAAIAAVFATGKISGGQEIGGLVGDNEGWIVASWADVAVTGFIYVGGLTGYNEHRVENSYFIGTVHSLSDEYIDGLVGFHFIGTHQGRYIHGTESDSYYNRDAYPVRNDRGKTTAELQSPTGYTGIYANWSTDVDRRPGGDRPWDFGASDQYPRLKADRDGDGVFTVAEFPGQNPRSHPPQDYDVDDDNLIEVSNVYQLHAIRYDLDGDGAPAGRHGYRYSGAYPDAAPGAGCPNACRGYELATDLDMDTNQNGRYDRGDIYYRERDSSSREGWRPIGNRQDGGPYTGEFHGNGHAIADLYVNRESSRAGLFGHVAGQGFVHHVGLPNVQVSGHHDTGALAGFVQGSAAAVAASWATGSVTGWHQTGGLVGSSQGSVAAAWTKVAVNGGRHVGGMVGHNGGSVAGVYALGTVASQGRGHGVVGWTGAGGSLSGVYYNHYADQVADPAHSWGLAELCGPTDYTGIYADWNLDVDGVPGGDDPWDFGDGSDCPALKYDRDGDGAAAAAAAEFSRQQENLGNVVLGTGANPVPEGLQANAGVDALALPGGTARLDGSLSTDPQGRPWHHMSYHWTQLSGPLVILQSRSSGRPAFVAPDAPDGTRIEFQLEVTTPEGDRDVDTVVITLSSEVPMPTAVTGQSVGGGDRPVEAGETVVLQGDASVNPHAGWGWRWSLTYRWEQLSGPAVSLSDPTAANSTFTVPADAARGTIYEFRLTVITRQGAAHSDTVTVAMPTLPQPTACAGPDLTGVPGEVVTLQGRCSTNPYGKWNHLAHAWKQLSGPEVQLSDATRGDPSFTIPADAAYGTALTFRLTVTDQEGVSDSDETTVTVSPPAPTPPTACAGDDLEAHPGDTVTLEGTCSVNPHGVWWRMAHLWTQPEGQNITLSDATKAKPSFTMPADAEPGTTYNFTLTVTDQDGESDSDSMTVTVASPPPDDRVDYDVDDDNLIEVASLAQLRAIYHDLNGDGQPDRGSPVEFHSAYANPRPNLGCAATCAGYELVADLDFDTNGNGRADAGDDYWNNGAGWEPIGGLGVGYSGEFHGNGHAIANLYLNRNGTDFGLFGRLGGQGYVHHVGLPDVSVTNANNGNVAGGTDTAALVGEVMSADAVVAASYATGTVSGGSETGGLVGDNEGRIVASWTDVAVSGANVVGGIAGDNVGQVVASYALGSVSGNSGGRVHGVVGHSHQGGSASHNYYNVDTNPGDGSGGKTAPELKAPTDYADIYAGWNVDVDRVAGGDRPWDFGQSWDYPLLKADRNGDGVYTWEEFSGQTRPDPSPPTAKAGPDLEAAPGERVTLQGKDSINPHGRWHQMAHRWTQPDGQGITLSDITRGDPWFDVPGDAASGTVYTFTLTVTDQDGETDSDTMTVTVENRGPAFNDGSETTRSIAENSPAGTNVGAAITATDPDGDTLTYTLSGDDSAAFAINDETGQLATKEGVTYDFEAKASYSLTVNANDGKGGTASIAVTVSLTNVNEAPAFSEGDTATREVAENSPAGTEVGAAVSATDPDGGDTLTYSLSGTDANAFEIGSKTGQLTTKSDVEYDYETQKRYSLTVNASDGNGGTASIAVTVSVTDVDETPPNRAPVFDDGSSATRSVAENSAAGVNVGDAITATDPDGGDTLTYSLSGTDASSFEIGDSTGQLTTKSGVDYDYETKSSYALIVSVSDGRDGTASIAVTVKLTDVAEATPVTACFTNLGTLSAAVEYAGSWSDANCKAHHQDSLGRYFHFTLSEETTVSISLSAGALYVSKDTPNNGWGTAPKGTYEHRKNVRRGNGKLVHDGSNSATLTLAAGATYTVEAAAASGDFTLSIAP